MKTVTRLAISRVIPLLDRQVLMVHVTTSDISRGWLGPVEIRGCLQTIRMYCIGVGETGDEPAIMLRLEQSDPRTIQDIVEAIGEPASCSLTVERVFGVDARVD